MVMRTWNVRALINYGKEENLKIEIKSLKIAILGIAEMNDLIQATPGEENHIFQAWTIRTQQERERGKLDPSTAVPLDRAKRSRKTMCV